MTDLQEIAQDPAPPALPEAPWPDARNKGVVLLNPRPLAATDRAVFCVLGTAGGGTTMTARLLEAAGIFMGGSRSGFNAEDPLFAKLLRDPNPDPAAFRDLVRRSDAARLRWGFKAPLRFHPELLSGVENIHYVLVFRDPLATGLRTVMSSGARPIRAIQIVHARQKLLLDFAARSNRPMLIFSYEKALTSPEGIARALLAFTGAAESAPVLARMEAIVQPDEPTYVAGQASLPAPVPELGQELSALPDSRSALPDSRSALRRRLSRLKARILRRIAAR